MESSVMLGSISFFIQPHFGGSGVRSWRHGVGGQPRANIYNRISAVFCDGDAPRHWRMPMWGGFWGRW